VYPVQLSSRASDVSISFFHFFNRLAVGGSFHVWSGGQQLVANLLFKCGSNVRVVRQELGRVGLALADLAAVVGIPGTRYLSNRLPGRINLPTL
jgi:hypothetical protein